MMEPLLKLQAAPSFAIVTVKEQSAGTLEFGRVQPAPPSSPDQFPRAGPESLPLPPHPLANLGEPKVLLFQS